MANLRIQVTHELLLDDVMRVARRAAAGDVRVILDVVAGTSRVLQSHGGGLAEADEALGRAGFFLASALRPRSDSGFVATPSAPQVSGA